MLKLYIYDHCPYCAKARMIFGLKDIPVEIITLLNDDEETPIKLIGQKMVPILQKEDGSFMPESMDIVRYIDENYGDKKIIAFSRDDKISRWLEKAQREISVLSKPRWTKVELGEFSTQESINYFINKKERYEGEFEDLIQDSPKHIKKIEAYLKELNEMLFSTEHALKGTLCEDDIHLFAALRSLSIVKGMAYPDKVRKYMEHMSQASKVALYFDTAI